MVARMHSRDYAISSRGFNTFQLSNKLLVLIDGRSVYTPLHAAVFWDGQQGILGEVARIEVIRGRAVAIWGANADNDGIIGTTTSAPYPTGGLPAVTGGRHQK